MTKQATLERDAGGHAVAGLMLAESLAARLCHDLGGAVGTLAGTLDLVEGEGGEMLELARETAVALRARMRLYAAAWGGGAEAGGRVEIAELLVGCSAAPRVRFDVAGLPDGPMLPAGLVPVVLNAAMLAVEALPMGGVVALAGDARGVVVTAAGRRAGWPMDLPELLAAADAATLAAAGPRRVLLPVLLAQLARLGWAGALAVEPALGAEATAALRLGPR